MKYELVGVVQRIVTESYMIEVEAEDPEEAQDVTYEVLSDYPNSEMKVDRLLKIDAVYESPTSIGLSFKREESEEVFDAENNEYDDEGPDSA